MSDRTPAAICRAGASPRPAVPVAGDWRDRAVDAVLRQGLLTVRCQQDDKRAARALAGLFFSPARRATLPACDDEALRDLAATLRACLDPTAPSAYWTRATAIVQKLLRARD